MKLPIDADGDKPQTFISGMAPSPANDHTILVQRIRSARSALRVTTDLQTRQALLDEIAAATEDLEELMLGEGDAEMGLASGAQSASESKGIDLRGRNKSSHRNGRSRKDTL